MSHPSKVKGNARQIMLSECNANNTLRWHDGEIWKTIPFAQDYAASWSGRIARFNECKTRTVPYVLPASTNGVKYALCKLSINGVKHCFKVHQVVCRTWHGIPKENQMVCHNDGNPSNNSVANLRWDTCKNNLADRRKHGTEIIGDRNGRSKLSWSDVNKVRNEYSGKYGEVALLSRKYNVSHSQMWEILHNKSWVEQCQQA
jgi:hypothetical protein